MWHTLFIPIMKVLWYLKFCSHCCKYSTCTLIQQVQLRTVVATDFITWLFKTNMEICMVSFHCKQYILWSIEEALIYGRSHAIFYATSRTSLAMYYHSWVNSYHVSQLSCRMLSTVKCTAWGNTIQQQQ